MTQTQIETLAAGFGLTVKKRITTGNQQAHFATFEVYGEPAALEEFWNVVVRKREDPCRLRPGFTTLRRVDNPRHSDYGQTYVSFESVWCEMVPVAEVARSVGPRTVSDTQVDEMLEDAQSTEKSRRVGVQRSGRNLDGKTFDSSLEKQ